MDLIYEAEGQELSSEFKAHFAHCPACSGEYMDLVSTRRWLSAWSDEEPPSQLVFISTPAKPRRLAWFSALLSLRPAPVFAFSLVAVLAFLALANVRITWENGRFGFQSGFQASAVGNLGSGAPAEAQTDILAAVDRMLTESEARQNRQTLSMLQRMADAVEYKRQMDLYQVRDELGLLHQDYFQALEKNSALLEQAAKVLRQNRY
jgi:hypothetical protein